MKTQYPIDEQETTINVFPKSVSEYAEIYTCIPHVIDRLVKLHEEYPDDVAVMIKDGYINATVPREWVKIQPKRQCTLTEEQKRANAERLAAYRNSKKGATQT